MNAPERPPTGVRPHIARIGRWALWAADLTANTLALSALAAIVVVLTWTVFGRFVLQESPSWGPEISLLLLGWIGFLGIAIGVRERAHIAVTFIVDRLPSVSRRFISRLTPLTFLVFGVYLAVQGWDFTEAMMANTLPATGLPTGFQYAAMPLSGLLITVYSLMHLFGLETSRQTESDPTAEEEPTKSEVEAAAINSAAATEKRVEGDNDR